MIGRVCACAELRPSLRVLILLLWRRRACRRPRSTASTACAMARSVSPRTLPLLHCAVVLLRSLLTTFRMHTGCQGKLEDARAHSQEVNRRQSGPAAAEVLNYSRPQPFAAALGTYGLKGVGERGSSNFLKIRGLNANKCVRGMGEGGTAGRGGKEENRVSITNTKGRRPPGRVPQALDLSLQNTPPPKFPTP